MGTPFRIQFSLRPLLLTTALFATWMGCRIHDIRAERQLHTCVSKSGGHMLASQAPFWRKLLLGEKDAVPVVVFYRRGLGEIDPAQLRQLKDLVLVGLVDCPITDEGLAVLKSRLPRVSIVALPHPTTTDHENR